MSLGNGNPREGDKGSNFDFERSSLKLLQSIADATAGGGGGGGTVTSVGLSMPAEFAVSGSPVTTSGTLGVTKASQAANEVYAAPDGASGQPSFRALTTGDLPETALYDNYNFVGYIPGGLGAREAMIMSLGAGATALDYGVFNPGAFTISHTDGYNLSIIDLSNRYSGTVYYEIGVIPAGTVSKAARITPVLGVATPATGVTSLTYTPTYGTFFTAFNTTSEAITYGNGTISFTPGASGSHIVFGIVESANTTLNNSDLYVFGNLKFVLA